MGNDRLMPLNALTREDKMSIKTLMVNDATAADTHIKLLMMSLYSQKSL